MFATHGKNVIGVDTNERVVQTLNRGDIHIEEPGLAAFVQSAIATGYLRVQLDVVPADVFIIAVPTPITENHKPDLTFVYAATEMIVPHLTPGNLVILESTSPPGTTESLVPLLEKSGLRVGVDLKLAHSPERVLPGRIMIEFVENDRVIGGFTPECSQAGAELYRTFVTGDIHLTTATTSEMVKLMENTYRDVNIALANEFSRVAERVEINVHEAIRLANHHPRVDILRPGPGVGGHCIAVDPWFIVDAASDVTTLIPAARQVNDGQPAYVIEQVCALMSDVIDPVIAVLGLAYKADVDDLRESPALSIVRLLQERGFRTQLHDPHCGSVPGLPLTVTCLDEAIAGADMLLILTDHAEYKRLRPSDVAEHLLRNKIVLDTRECLDRALWVEYGYDVHRIGVGTSRRAQVAAA